MVWTRLDVELWEFQISDPASVTCTLMGLCIFLVTHMCTDVYIRPVRPAEESWSTVIFLNSCPLALVTPELRQKYTLPGGDTVHNTKPLSEQCGIRANKELKDAKFSWSSFGEMTQSQVHLQASQRVSAGQGSTWWGHQCVLALYVVYPTFYD